jgi:DNA invertase Pin-like site-specific DNA recombinase
MVHQGAGTKLSGNISAGSPADGWPVLGRPEFSRMIEDAHKRQFDMMLCWALDRFTDLMNNKHDYLRRAIFPKRPQKSPVNVRVIRDLI